MSATQFHLTTGWSFDAPPQALWQALMTPEEWPSWWRAVAQVDRLAGGDANGIGAVRRMTWRTALPYTLTFAMRITRVEPFAADKRTAVIEGRAEGELTGLGRWTLTDRGGAHTDVRYEWIVEVTKPWQRLLAPALRPVFTWNHNKVMQWGYEGLSRKLAAQR